MIIFLMTACAGVPVLKAGRPLVENVVASPGQIVEQHIAQFIEQSSLYKVVLIDDVNYQITQEYRSALGNYCKTIKHRSAQGAIQQGEFKACKTNNQWQFVSHVIAEMKP